MARDPKGIYRNAAEAVPRLQAHYEPPENPDLVIDGLRESPIDTAKRILAILPVKSGNAAQS